ncbi:hypothetical protein BLOT_001773 [Blomia tropicalis]|nr:hypothetical protein BLOT_001773 [Blomia tropicalis]
MGKAGSGKKTNENSGNKKQTKVEEKGVGGIKHSKKSTANDGSQQKKSKPNGGAMSAKTKPNSKEPKCKEPKSKNEKGSKGKKSSKKTKGKSGKSKGHGGTPKSDGIASSKQPKSELVDDEPKTGNKHIKPPKPKSIVEEEKEKQPASTSNKKKNQKGAGIKMKTLVKAKTTKVAKVVHKSKAEDEHQILDNDSDESIEKVVIPIKKEPIIKKKEIIVIRKDIPVGVIPAAKSTPPPPPPPPQRPPPPPSSIQSADDETSETTLTTVPTSLESESSTSTESSEIEVDEPIKSTIDASSDIANITKKNIDNEESKIVDNSITNVNEDNSQTSQTNNETNNENVTDSQAEMDEAIEEWQNQPPKQDENEFTKPTINQQIRAKKETVLNYTTTIATSEFESLYDEIYDLNTASQTLRHSYGSIIKSLVHMHNRRMKKKGDKTNREQQSNKVSSPEKTTKINFMTTLSEIGAQQLKQLKPTESSLKHVDKYDLERFINPVTREETFKMLFDEIDQLNEKTNTFRNKFFDSRGNFMRDAYNCQQPGDKLDRKHFNQLKLWTKKLANIVDEIERAYNDDLLNMFRNND